MQRGRGCQLSLYCLSNWITDRISQKERIRRKKKVVIIINNNKRRNISLPEEGEERDVRDVRKRRRRGERCVRVYKRENELEQISVFSSFLSVVKYGTNSQQRNFSTMNFLSIQPTNPGSTVSDIIHSLV